MTQAYDLRHSVRTSTNLSSQPTVSFDPNMNFSYIINPNFDSNKLSCSISCAHFPRASQQKNLPFSPCGRRVSPIQAASCHLQSGHGECLPATQLYLSVFTCPTVSLDLPSDSHRTPARASRPDNLTFSTPRPARLTHPDREYFPPVGCRREPPGHTSYIVMSLPVQRSES